MRVHVHGMAKIHFKNIMLSVGWLVGYIQLIYVFKMENVYS